MWCLLDILTVEIWRVREALFIFYCPMTSFHSQGFVTLSQFPWVSGLGTALSGPLLRCHECIWRVSTGFLFCPWRLRVPIHTHVLITDLGPCAGSIEVSAAIIRFHCPAMWPSPSIVQVTTVCLTRQQEAGHSQHPERPIQAWHVTTFALICWWAARLCAAHTEAEGIILELVHCRSVLVTFLNDGSKYLTPRIKGGKVYLTHGL